MTARERLLDILPNLTEEDCGRVLNFIYALKLNPNISATMLLAEESLAKFRNCPEEDAAWAHL
ncbi:MAG: hypothetical protein FWC67_01255 [Defluviitaleaceae bacterium]|nr:hypothetical protein [Defluviitaleaceae bacterium]